MTYSHLRARLAVGTAALAVALLGTAVAATPAYAADGRSLPTGSALYTLPCDELLPSPQLFSIGATTAAATAIGAPAAEESFCSTGAAWNPVNSTAYYVSSIENDALATVNLTTGVSATIAPFTLDGEEEGVSSLAIGLDGSAFAVSGDDLFSVDLMSAELTEVGSLGFSGLFGFAVDPTTGEFFAISPEGLLYSVDVTTGAATVVGDTGLNSIDFNLPWSLQIDSAGMLWIEAYSFEGETGLLSNLWSIDPADLGDSAVLSGAITAGEGTFLTESLLFVPAVVAPVAPPVVQPAAIAPVTPPAPQLANTGVDAAPIAAGGALVALLGMALLVRAIRRRVNA